MSILKGKMALVTGADGGLGSAVVREFMDCGCFVVSVCGADYDFSNNNDLERLVQRIGDVDILVNCAGIFLDKPILKSEMKDFDRCMAVNLRAPFFLIRHFAPGMVRKKWGRIINIASAAAYRGSSGKSIYCASKHALLGMSRSLFREFRETGVRVYCISPEAMQTDMAKGLTTSGPFDTFILPESVAKHIVFVISQDGEMISDEVQLNRIQS